MQYDRLAITHVIKPQKRCCWCNLSIYLNLIRNFNYPRNSTLDFFFARNMDANYDKSTVYRRTSIFWAVFFNWFSIPSNVMDWKQWPGVCMSRVGLWIDLWTTGTKRMFFFLFLSKSLLKVVLLVNYSGWLSSIEGVGNLLTRLLEQE